MANDKKLIDELLERDKAKPVKKYVPITEGLGPWAMCPSCGQLLLRSDAKFCDQCGQRVLIDTWELLIDTWEL